MPQPHVLVVDDDENIRSALFTLLNRSGYRVTALGEGGEALEVFRSDPPNVVLTDLRMPGMDGLRFVEILLEEDPDTMVLVLTGHGTVEETVELMRRGVHNVLTKPLSVKEILFLVEKAVREQALRQRNRDLERRLEITERLAMIGKLAAGVAHELNSPLDGVIRFVKLNLDAFAPDSEAREFQEDALSGLKRMSSIVKDLLTFSRNIALEVEEEGLERILRDAVKQVSGTEREKEIEVVYELAIPDVRVPRGMSQVFSNLVKNAFDAMGRTGTLSMRAGVRDGEVFVEIEDTGCGIRSDLQDRVFEPFFTTKDVGKGTGLGLSIVSRIMERFGGAVNLESREGEGTTITVYLPAVRELRQDERSARESVGTAR